MRIQIPKFQEKKDLFQYLKENKSELIKTKKSMPIYSDVADFGVSKVKRVQQVDLKNEVKAEGKQSNDDVLRVKVVANTANFIDSHMDMLLADCWSKSISERKSFIPHLHDHKHEIGAKVGEVVDIFSSNLSYSELGVNGVGSTQSLIFLTDIMKEYNESVFNQYKKGKINQHSIGLQYVKLDLAINDPESEKEFEFWNK